MPYDSLGRASVACEDFGADSGVSAETNTRAIQAALNAGGMVTLRRPGAYKITADNFTMGAGTVFDYGPGVTFTIAGVATELTSVDQLSTVTTGSNFPNKWTMSWRPTSNSTALLSAGYGDVDYDSTTYDVTGAGHGIGWLGRFRHQTARTVALGVGIEGVVESNGSGAITQGWGVVSHISVNGASSSISTAAGFSDIVDTSSSGAITAYAGVLLNDMSGVSGITYKYGVYQLDSAAWNIYRGRSWGAQQAALGGVPVLPEIAPAMSPGIASSRYYTTPHGSTITTLAIGANILYCCPFYVPERTTWTEIGVEVTSAAAASSLLRVGIYRAYSGRPQALILDGGAKAADSTGLKTSTISQVLEAGWYFLAVFSNGTPTVRAITDTATTLHGLTNTTALDTLIGGSATYGVMPDRFPASLIYANGGTLVPLLWMRKS